MWRSHPLLFTALLCISLSGRSQQSVVIDNIIVIGNQRTREHVVLREIPFKKGDVIDTADFSTLKSSAHQTLTNTSLFNFVAVDFTVLDSSRALCVIKLQERWYIWPGVIFSLAETNFNSWWENKDFDRINYGFYVQDFNFRGRLEKLTVNFQHGWQRRIGLNYQVPGLNKARTLGGGLEITYANNREINYASADNKRLFFKDQHFIQEEFKFNGKVEYRPQYYNKHRFNAGLNTVIIHDTVMNYSIDYLPENRLRSQYLFFSYGFKREKRDNVGYPLKGYVVDASIDQDGIGLIHSNDLKITEAVITFNTHHALGGRWYFAHGVKAKSTLSNAHKVPYYIQRGLGYSNAFIRGYELYVIDGQHYGLYKSNIKFQLLKKRTIDLGSKNLGVFDKFHYSIFLNAFADAGYVVDKINAMTNPLANNWQYAGGIGLDFVTYYDIVIRFEGSINKQGVPGFYVHFKNPI